MQIAIVFRESVNFFIDFMVWFKVITTSLLGNCLLKHAGVDCSLEQYEIDLSKTIQKLCDAFQV